MKVKKISSPVVVYLIILLATIATLFSKIISYEYFAVLLIFLIFLPLEVSGYYGLKRLLKRSGLKTNIDDKNNEKFSFSSHLFNWFPVPEVGISTNIFLKSKNKIFRYVFNFLGDLLINFLYLLYILATLILSGIIVWSLLKMFRFF